MSNFPYPLLHMLHRASPVANSNDGVPRSQMASATAVVGRCLRLLLVDVCEKRSARFLMGFLWISLNMLYTIWYTPMQIYYGRPYGLSSILPRLFGGTDTTCTFCIVWVVFISRHGPQVLLSNTEMHQAMFGSCNKFQQIRASKDFESDYEAFMCVLVYAMQCLR